ncbi:MAG: hypothetical protein ACRDD4_00360 [Culicoidibacterales bacterium]
MKKLIIGAVILFLMVGVWNVFGTESEVKSEQEQVQVETPTEEVDTNVALGDVTYEVVSVDDSSTPQAVRHTLNVVVTGSEVTEAKLFKIAKLESLLYTSSNDVNALSVGFYSSAENIGQGYDYGYVDYAPEGDWSKASEVLAGDYSTFEFDNNLY